jgi:uncharacterized coiled-coil protein SlyX
LQNQLKDTEKNIKEEINKGLEQARVADKQEIKLLKSSLDELYKKMKNSQGQATHQEELVRQL